MLSHQLRNLIDVPSDADAETIMDECYRVTKLLHGGTLTSDEKQAYFGNMLLVLVTVGQAARSNPSRWSQLFRDRDNLVNIGEAFSTFFTVIADHGHNQPS